MDKQLTRPSMWNFVTQQHDTLDGVPTTDEAARQYIPQHGPAQGLYQVHRQLGASIADALLAVLTVIVDAHEGQWGAPTYRAPIVDNETRVARPPRAAAEGDGA